MKTIWKIDPAHSSAQFVVRHMMITNVRGGFSGVQGTVVYDPDDLSSSSIDVTIDKNTLSTGDATRDTHVKSADFLDVENYPTITFKSKKITKDGDGLKVTGDLTIHGVTKDVVLNVEGPTEEQKDPWGNIEGGRISYHQDQAERLWPDVERSARDWRHYAGRRSQTRIGCFF